MKDVFVHPTAEVDETASIGKGCKIWNGAQVREGVVLGEYCTLGMGVYIDQRVCIGDRVKIQNGSSVYYGVTLGNDVFVGPHVSFTNDLYPRAFNPHWEIHHTVVLDGASIGSNSTIICGITLHPFCMVGAGSVVTRDVPAYALVRGNPARVVDFVCRCGVPLGVDLATGRPPTAECRVCQAPLQARYGEQAR